MSHPAAPAWPGPALTPLSPATLAPGVTLTGAAWAADTLHLRLALDGPYARQAQLRSSGLDATNTVTMSRTVPFWRDSYACAGDTIIFSLPLSLPNGTTHVRVDFGTDLTAPSGTVTLPLPGNTDP